MIDTEMQKVPHADGVALDQYNCVEASLQIVYQGV